MVKDQDDDEHSSDVINFTWDVVGFDKDFIWLKIRFENPEDLGASFSSQDFITVTFWGVEFFKSF